MKAYAQNLINTNYMLSTLADKHGYAEVLEIRICLCSYVANSFYNKAMYLKSTKKKILNNVLVDEIYFLRLKFTFSSKLEAGIVLVKGRKNLHWSFSVCLAWEEV